MSIFENVYTVCIRTFGQKAFSSRKPSGVETFKTSKVTATLMCLQNVFKL